MADDWYLNLDRRLNDIENRVFGKADKDADYVQCITSLANLHTHVNAAIKGREKLSQVFDNLSLIEKFVDPQFSEQLTLPQSVKLDLIMIQEDFITTCVSQLQKVEETKTVFDSQHIQAVPGMVDKLQRISEIQLKQQDETVELSERVAQLLNIYNSLITNLSKQFIQWEVLLTEIEMASQVKESI